MRRPRRNIRQHGSVVSRFVRHQALLYKIERLHKIPRNTRQLSYEFHAMSRELQRD
jgi:hypothetical protein